MKVWDITFEMDWDPPGSGQLKIRAECEDDSKCEFQFSLPVDVVEQLHAAVVREYGPHVEEREMARAEYLRGHGKPFTVQQAEAQDLLDMGVYKDDPAKQIWAERVARGEE